jgi:hypothetical protein
MKGSPAGVLSHQEVDAKRQDSHPDFGERGHLCSVSDLILI